VYAGAVLESWLLHGLWERVLVEDVEGRDE
jgi:hypothetical protein